MRTNRMLRVLPIVLLLTACGPDETISGYAVRDATYRLIDIDGTDFAARATISFGDNGSVTGRGPCNSFHSTQTLPYPWFNLDPIASTRVACPDLAAEQIYFAALADMTLAESFENVLILSNTDDREMVFQVE